MAGPEQELSPTVLSNLLVSVCMKVALGAYPENEAPLGLAAEVGALTLAVGSSSSSSDSQTSLYSQLAICLTPQEPRPHWLFHCGPAVLPGDWPAGRRHGGLWRRECGAWHQGEWSFSHRAELSSHERMSE